MSSDLLNNQMLDASLKAYDWRVKTVAILLSQIFIHLVEPLFFQVLHFFKFLQLKREIFTPVEIKFVPLEIMLASDEITRHYFCMLFYIVKFNLFSVIFWKAEPIVLNSVPRNHNKVDKVTDNQNNRPDQLKL